MSDPMADVYNMMGAQGMFNPNPYLEFTGQIPLAGYAGSPINAATGQPIQTPGMTLNSPPSQQSSPAAAQSMGGPYYYGNVASPGGIQSSGQFNPSTMLAGAPGVSRAQSNQNLQTAQNQIEGLGPGMWQGMAGAGAGATSAAAQPSGAANSREAYLQAMANPGLPPQPGAVMQPGAQPTGAPQPSVLAAFLAAHPSGGKTGAGGYTNQPFFSTLQQLQSQGAAGTT